MGGKPAGACACCSMLDAAPRHLRWRGWDSPAVALSLAREAARRRQGSAYGPSQLRSCGVAADSKEAVLAHVAGDPNAHLGVPHFRRRERERCCLPLELDIQEDRRQAGEGSEAGSGASCFLVVLAEIMICLYERCALVHARRCSRAARTGLGVRGQELERSDDKSETTTNMRPPPTATI